MGGYVLFPVRCFTCGKPIGGLWEKYKARVETGEPVKKALDGLGVERYCCRAAFLTHTEALKDAMKFRV